MSTIFKAQWFFNGAVINYVASASVSLESRWRLAHDECARPNNINEERQKMFVRELLERTSNEQKRKPFLLLIEIYKTQHIKWIRAIPMFVIAARPEWRISQQSKSHLRDDPLRGLLTYSMPLLYALTLSATKAARTHWSLCNLEQTHTANTWTTKNKRTDRISLLRLALRTLI